jgi:hypothetical protein
VLFGTAHQSARSTRRLGTVSPGPVVAECGEVDGDEGGDPRLATSAADHQPGFAGRLGWSAVPASMLLEDDRLSLGERKAEESLEESVPGCLGLKGAGTEPGRVPGPEGHQESWGQHAVVSASSLPFVKRGTRSALTGVGVPAYDEALGCAATGDTAMGVDHPWRRDGPEETRRLLRGWHDGDYSA